MFCKALMAWDILIATFGCGLSKWLCVPLCSVIFKFQWSKYINCIYFYWAFTMFYLVCYLEWLQAHHSCKGVFQYFVAITYRYTGIFAYIHIYLSLYTYAKHIHIQMYAYQFYTTYNIIYRNINCSYSIRIIIISASLFYFVSLDHNILFL